MQFDHYVVAFYNTTQACKYQRRLPENSLLFRTIENYWPRFLKERSYVNKKLPLFIHQEFEAYLRCGLPEFGFVRTYCYQCQYSGIIAFSCKRRGFCPSCAGKRMNDEADHITKNVVPEITTRQWVLSFPYRIRYVLAHNQKLTNEFLKIFIKTIQSYQRKRIKNKNAKIGAITFIQRFGSALNLNVHFHTLMTDGVYLPNKDNTNYFVRLPHPTHEELQKLITKIKNKIERKLKKLNIEDQLPFEEESLEDISQLSIAHQAAFGERKGKALKQYGIKSIETEPEGQDPTTANISGFSLNARVWIAHNKRKKLEQLIRYMARGPIAQERMTETYTGQILYKLKTPWKNGVTHFSYSGLDFIARLVALIPPPRMNMVRYHGVFAPNFKHRNKIVPKTNKKISEVATDKKTKNERLRWAEMLKKTFEIDVTICPKCNGRLEQIAVIQSRTVGKAILESLKLEIHVAKTNAPTTGPPEQISYEYEDDQRNSEW